MTTPNDVPPEDPLDLALRRLPHAHGPRRAEVIDEASKLALVSIAQDVRAVRQVVPRALSAMTTVMKAAVVLAAGLAQDIERTADHRTGKTRDGTPLQ